MVRARTILGMCLICFAVSACFQSGGGEWFKPGVAGDLTARDLAQCQRDARLVVGEEGKIDQDIIASRGADWQASGSYAANTSQMAQSSDKRRVEMVGRCMRNKGYTQPK
ncbi:MAG: hypothetical protein IT562_22685 [Alphaproteobacteria bacterium]|nr:hypothetical protein [Alphaproteobacteria bacterium]